MDSVRIGHKFHKFTVVEQLAATRWRCQCECGNFRDLYQHKFNLQSCGCSSKHKSAVKVGNVYHSINYGEYVITEYIHASSVKVKFLATGYEYETTTTTILAGHTRDNSVPRVSPNLRSNLDKFLARAKEVHGDRYNYSMTEYITSNAQMDIICKLHGAFRQSSSSHLGGSGCHQCAAIATRKGHTIRQETVIERFRAKHGDRYDYSNVVYTKAKNVVSIICREHGEFLQIAQHHQAGSGCPSCTVGRGGFRTTEAGYLYVLLSDEITKVGITNQTAAKRAREVSTSASRKFEVLKIFPMDGYAAQQLETKILRQLAKEYFRPVVKFEGSSECFIDVDRPKLIRDIEKEITDYGK